MSPDRDSYITAANNNDSSKYQLIAMSTLASGAIPAQEAYGFINQQKVQSVVFGASTEHHIRETLGLIKLN
jgi:aryl-alcohol dehydrogenase-like predicted oxidoreductase